jgi:cell division initiation protein
MKISPLDIQQQQFKGKMLGGLDPDDVDSFLQLVSEEMETLIRENNDLREQARKVSGEMEELNQREKTLRETMLAAQRITEEMKANATKEAALLITEAEMKAEKIVAEAENRLVRLRNEIQDTKRQKVQFDTSLKSLLDTHYKMLDLNEE